MRWEDAATVAVFLFTEQHYPPSEIDKKLRLPAGSAVGMISYWWELISEREGW